MEENNYSLKKSNKGRINGYFILIIGLISGWIGIWLFIQTLGTRLLFIDARIGKVSRYYFIFILATCVCFGIGVLCLKRFPAVKREVKKIKGIKEIKENEIKTELDKSVCPSCGKANAKESKFCIFCGSSMK